MLSVPITVDQDKIHLMFASQDVLDRDEAERRAEKVTRAYRDLLLSYEELPDDFLITVGEAFVEVTGIEWFDDHFVFSILESWYRFERPEDQEYIKVEGRWHRTYGPLVTEFFYIMVKNPDVTDEEELLWLFRQHVRVHDVLDESKVQNGVWVEDYE